MDKHEKVYQRLRRSGFDGWGGKNYPARMEGLKTNLRNLLDVIDLSSSAKILELGSGAGDLSIMLNEMGYDVSGVEISETAVEWANEKSNGQIRFVCSSVTDSAIFEGERFELLIDGNCLHCLFDDDRHLFYKNAQRLLVKNGYLYIATVIANHEGESAVVGPIPRCFMTKEQILNEAKKYNFELVTSWTKEHNEYSHFCGVLKINN